jgi:hypothetical protein
MLYSVGGKCKDLHHNFSYNLTTFTHFRERGSGDIIITCGTDHPALPNSRRMSRGHARIRCGAEEMELCKSSLS